MKQELFLTYGVHIGTQRRRKDMDEYVYKIRPDGLAVMNIQKVEEKLQAAARFLSKFEPSEVLAVGARDYAQQVIRKFTEVTKCSKREGRFLPGSLTNPSYEAFIEPKVILVADPIVDRQAVVEANQVGIPVVAFCDTNNTKEFVDVLIPGNNKGKKSLAMLYWALATFWLQERGELQDGGELTTPIEEFLNSK